MNHANVDALHLLLDNATIPGPITGTPMRLVSGPAARDLAKLLAESGVLVPSSLTDQEVADLFDVPPGHAATRREYLEQLAKGES